MTTLLRWLSRRLHFYKIYLFDISLSVSPGDARNNVDADKAEIAS